MSTLDVEAFNETPFAQRLIQIELGLASWPEPDAKRHHFIPQFMLNRFAKVDERIFQLEKATGRPQRISVSEAASRRHFYRFENDEGDHSSVIEGIFGMAENDAAPALARLECDSVLSDVDRASIALFLAYLWARTPAARKGAELVGEQLRLNMLATELADRNAFHQKLAALAEEHEDLRQDTAEDAEALRLRMIEELKRGDVSSKDSDGGYTTGLLLGSAHELAMEFFAGMTWTLSCAIDGAFITSDRGTVSVDPTPPHPWSGATPMSSPNATTYFPVSAACCIVMRPGEPTLSVEGLSGRKVTEVNLRIYGWAERFIYGGTQEAVASVRRALKTTKASLAVEPKPARMVTLIERDPEDDRLAKLHQARGWPPYLRGVGDDGTPEFFDYMIIGETGTAVEIGLTAEELVEERARRRGGWNPGEIPPGNVRVEAIHPTAILPTHRSKG
jgi:hypothetical protein